MVSVVPGIMSFWSICRFLTSSIYPIQCLKIPLNLFIIHGTSLKTLRLDRIPKKRENEWLLRDKTTIYVLEVHRLCLFWHFACNLSFFFNSWLLSDFFFQNSLLKLITISPLAFLLFFLRLFLSIKDNSQFKNQIIFCCFIRQADEKCDLEKIYLVL